MEFCSITNLSKCDPLLLGDTLPPYLSSCHGLYRYTAKSRAWCQLLRQNELFQ